MELKFDPKNILTSSSNANSFEYVIPNTRTFLKDSFMQMLLCQSRDQYMCYRITNTFNSYVLEFVPNYYRYAENFQTKDESNLHPYCWDVNLIDTYNAGREEKTHILQINNFEFKHNWDATDRSKPERKQFEQITYKFRGNAEFTTNLLFDFNWDERAKIISYFGEEYIIINYINFYLCNMVISKYDFHIKPYDIKDFININDFPGMEISDDYKRIINNLLQRENQNESFIAEPLSINNNNSMSYSMGDDFFVREITKIKTK